MFNTMASNRWRPNRILVTVMLVGSGFIVIAASAYAALLRPVALDYQVIRSGAEWWRVTSVWPSSFAWDAGLRPGMLIHARTSPPLIGAALVHLQAHPCCRAVTIPPRENIAPGLAVIELLLAAAIMSIGLATVLVARARRAALHLVLVCATAAVGLCGVAAFAHGAIWGSILFELCWFALLPPSLVVLATVLPVQGRTLALHRRLLGTYTLLVLALQASGFLDVGWYKPTRNIEGVLFILAQGLAVAIWIWRAAPARGTSVWPEYQLVLCGLGGAFGGFALLAIAPTVLHWQLPWPREANSFVLLLFPVSLSLAILRYELLSVRRTIQRTAVTALLLSMVFIIGLVLIADGMRTIDLVVVVLLAGLGVPLAQDLVDRVLPDAQAPYAALLRISGQGLGLAVDISDTVPTLEMLQRGLGLRGLAVCRDDIILVQVGVLDHGHIQHLPIIYEDAAVAQLRVGEKLHHDRLLSADHEALAILCQQLGSFLARQRLVLQLSQTIARLEETQERLLTARRVERERLGQQLHRGPLQDILLLRQMLPPHSPAVTAAGNLAQALRSILTETAATALHDLGLPAALRAYTAHLAPHARASGCAMILDLDDQAALLANDESFALYQLAHEALVNTVRHSGAARVMLSLHVVGGEVILDVRDDGRGLPQGWDQIRVDHRGLRTALDLVQTIRGASATATACAGGGTHVRACVPLRRRAHSKEETVHEKDGIRVLIAEDHGVVRHGLRSLLTEDARFVVVAEASNGHEILSLVLQYQPDILLLDIDLPGLNGLDALAHVQAHATRVPRTLVLSAFHEEEYVRRAREAGVDGFLSKECDGPTLRQAIARIMAGASVFDPTVTAMVRDQRYNKKGHLRRYTDGSEVLSPAEVAVLRRMVGEQPYEEIAHDLGRSYSTVRTQAARVCAKLGVNNRQQAVLKALHLGIVRLESPTVGGEAEQGHSW